MKKVLAVLNFVILLSANTWAQDLLILKDGTDIQVKVLEVLVDEIRYKKFSNLDGPTYTMEKDFVFMIKYANGDKDLFGNTQPSKETPPVSEKKKTDTKDALRKGSFIALYGGLGIPIGEYSKTSLTKTAGYASIGYNAGIQGAYFPIPYVGLGAMVGVAGNGLNDEELLKDGLGGYQATVVDEFSVGYTNVYFGGGPYFQLPTRIVNVSLHGFIGGNYVIGPEYRYQIVYQGASSLSTYNMSDVVGLAYGGGLDLRFNVSKLICINIGAMYIMSNTNHSYNGTAGTGKSEIITQLITANAGLGIRLGK